MNHDSPGVNTSLNPEAAPVWMHRLVDTVRTTEQRPPTTAAKQAAVLMLFSGTETSATLPNDAAVLLTHRSPSMRSHSGQIAFPGGRLDPTDANIVDCALREAWEETGLDRTTVTPLAQLSEVHILASGYPVHPVLGHWHTPMNVGVVSPEGHCHTECLCPPFCKCSLHIFALSWVKPNFALIILRIRRAAPGSTSGAVLPPALNLEG